MRVLQVIPAFLPATRYGGPPMSVLRLCQGLIQAGVDVELVTTDADGPGGRAEVTYDRLVDVEGVPVRYFRRYPRYEYGLSLPFVRFALDELGGYDLVHVTPLFTFISTLTPLLARRSRVPYVVSPRGMCMPWSLQRRSWKKLPYWHAFERPNLSRAAGLHATSEPEEEQLRRLFPGAAVFTVPNAVPIDDAPSVAREPGRVLFVGRLHPVKGFDVLVPAMSLLARRMPEVELVLAGPDDHGEWARIQERVAAADPRPRVRWVGPVEGAKKAELYASAAAFVMTSHLESFGNAIVEALGAGTPVVAGRNCPWRGLDRAGAGHWVDNTPSAIAGALERVLAAKDGAAMQAAARKYAASFSIAAVGKQMAARYRALLDGSGAGERFTASTTTC